MNIRQFIQTKSMKTIVGLFFLALLFGASDARAQCDGPKRVAFQRGLTTAVLKSAIPTSKAICYQLRARASQKMIVHLAAPARGVLFTVIPEGYDVEPLVTLETKRRILHRAAAEQWLLIFEHDATTAWGRLDPAAKAYALRPR